MKTIWAGIASLGMIFIGMDASAARPLSRAQPVHRLSCAEIATRIQALNRPIGAENNPWHQLRRNPTPQFVLLGIVTPDPEHDARLDQLRQERNALIAQAVDEDCAARR